MFIDHILLIVLCDTFALFAVKGFVLGVWMRPRDLTSEIIGAAIRIHRKLGPGLLESAYEACLAYELENLRLRVERQKPVPLVYESVKLDCGFRADIVVEARVVGGPKVQRGTSSSGRGTAIVPTSLAECSGGTSY